MIHGNDTLIRFDPELWSDQTGGDASERTEVPAKGGNQREGKARIKESKTVKRKQRGRERGHGSDRSLNREATTERFERKPVSHVGRGPRYQKTGGITWV